MFRINALNQRYKQIVIKGNVHGDKVSIKIRVIGDLRKFEDKHDRSHVDKYA